MPSGTNLRRRNTQPVRLRPELHRKVQRARWLRRHMLGHMPSRTNLRRRNPQRVRLRPQLQQQVRWCQRWMQRLLQRPVRRERHLSEWHVPIMWNPNCLRWWMREHQFRSHPLRKLRHRLWWRNPILREFGMRAVQKHRRLHRVGKLRYGNSQLRLQAKEQRQQGAESRVRCFSRSDILGFLVDPCDRDLQHRRCGWLSRFRVALYIGFCRLRSVHERHRVKCPIQSRLPTQGPGLLWAGVLFCEELHWIRWRRQSRGHLGLVRLDDGGAILRHNTCGHPVGAFRLQWRSQRGQFRSDLFQHRWGDLLEHRTV
jgi:hypothetical protein